MFVHYAQGFFTSITPSRSKNKNKGKKKLEDSIDNSMAKMKAIRKPKQPNWECQEIVSLIQAKKKKHKASIGVVDSKDFFENTIVKWKEIVSLVMASSHSAYVKNRLACNENLWTTLCNDYK